MTTARRAIAFLGLLAAALLGCAETPSTVAYNRGVDAYRAGDFAQARTEWARSVEEGDPDAMNNLGYLWARGFGGEADLARAVALWERAARLGQSESMLHLGVAYERGVGVAKDEAQAYAWYFCAVRNAEAGRGRDPAAEQDVADDARRRLVDLVENLPATRLDEARARAYDCRPRP